MRSHYCNDINSALIDQNVSVCGWVHHRRDHGGVIFIDLRDRSGIVQVVFNPDQQELFELAQSLRNEFVLNIKGLVRKRPEGTINSTLASGEVEIMAQSLEILNASLPTPFAIDEHHGISEEVRLKYRYLDLRRPEVANRFIMRATINRFLRGFLEERGFLEVETPILTKATPEGARDYLVPSRTHPGQCFALPQSPQIFKQLLMVAGFDRYYQIVRCFRDEDLRAERQPEFTQLDIEMSFIDEEMICSTMEQMIRDLFASLLNVALPSKFPTMTYQDAMDRYGVDRPDLRIPLQLVEISDLMQHVEFKVFNGPANDPNSRVAVLRLPNGADLSRKNIDNYTALVAKYGAKGLAYIKINDLDQGMDGLQSPILKFLPEAVVMQIIERTEAVSGDLLFFGADKAGVVNQSLAALRVALADDHNLYEGDWRPVWITDFPMFEKDGDGKWQALHHPFTAPQESDPQKLLANPGSTLSRAYDMVINGYEVGGGSIRIHQQTLQEAAFEILGISKDEASEKFNHLMQALQYGCPPHGGIAFGLDRLTMLMTGTKSIREVIAFPKTQTAACPLTNAPSAPIEAQLRELNMRWRTKAKEKEQEK